VLAIQASLQPSQLSGLVVQLAAEGLPPRTGIGDHRHRGGSDVEADESVTYLVAGQRLAVQDQLPRVDPPTPDLATHDPARTQPPRSHVRRRPPVVGAGRVERERENEASAPLKAAAVGRDPQRATPILDSKAVQAVALAFEARAASAAQHPAVDRVVRPGAQYLRLLREDPLAEPAHPQPRGDRHQLPLAEAVARPQLPECPGPSRVRLAGHQPRHRGDLLPGGVSPYRCGPVQRHPQAGVVEQPGALKATAHLSGLRRGSPQRNRGHEGRGVLRPLPSPGHHAALRCSHRSTRPSAVARSPLPVTITRRSFPRQTGGSLPRTPSC
jgi:hypothetical protein